MMNLDDEEVAALRMALDRYLPELGRDLARIDRLRDRHELAALERTLSNLRRKLDDAGATPRPT
jgi:hypothetical protein